MFYICRINPRAKKKVSTHEGAFSSSFNLPRELAPKPLVCIGLNTAALNRAGTQYLCRAPTFVNVQLNPALHTPVNTDTSL